MYNSFIFVKTWLIEPVIQQIAKEYKKALSDLYGSELAELILFGSYARGDYKAESDVDFAIVLHDPATRPATEILKTAGIASKLSLKYGLPISSLHVALQKKQNSWQSVYQQIRKEGIVI